ncbi:hypothetical protein [Streptomyces sp. NBC_01217]|uniref:hypothetical protein n=1 Tax=Streptomyces sp. NBC_01217 TaxID=2903779 RepID=UPI002E0E99B1|nr:hypothetical protein OG507_00525 [Streptomyces sp. NBC_01217]WSQ62514.1 hypothetical protein OG507_39045 [Streptomyces sp. NBC_01217]
MEPTELLTDSLPLREIAAGYLAGLECADLGDTYGVPAGTINYWLAMTGVPLCPGSRGVPLDCSVLDSLVRRRKNGETLAKLGPSGDVHSGQIATAPVP